MKELISKLATELLRQARSGSLDGIPANKVTGIKTLWYQNGVAKLAFFEMEDGSGIYHCYDPSITLEIANQTCEKLKLY